MRKHIYRKCACGETAHDLYWSIIYKQYMYRCRNRNP